MAEENQTQETKEPSEYERKKLKKEEEKRQRETGKSRKGAFKTLSIVFIVFLLVGVGGWWILSQEPAEKSEIVAEDGMHWHANISITINGEKREVPANLGIGVTHSPVHTHDADGVIHLEFSGVVRENDIKIAKLFDEWDKTFTSVCIFEFCSGESGKVKMLVNGEENNDFGDYIMRDGDKIEITYGKGEAETTEEEVIDGEEASTTESNLE